MPTSTMDRPRRPSTSSSTASELTARAGESILDAALRHGVEIPHLCHQRRAAPDGNCRACVVEIDGERTLWPPAAAARQRPA
jgi:NADH dehydrogenase/NADH:ubiquinone oxidoreductase subunit G